MWYSSRTSLSQWSKNKDPVKLNENFALEIGRPRTHDVLINHPDWATEKF